MDTVQHHMKEQSIYSYESSTTQYYGYSVSIYNNTSIVGAYRANFVGDVYIYKFKYNETIRTNTWQSIAYLSSLYDQEYNDRFGWSVCIYKDWAIVGAENIDTAFIFAGIA